MSSKLSVSIVTYRPNLKLLNKVLSALDQNARNISDYISAPNINVFLVDNGNDFNNSDESKLSRYSHLNINVLTGHGNVGYGLGNNIAFNHSSGDYFLVLNPDVILAEDSLTSALSFMAVHPGCGLLVPNAFDSNHQKLYLCKRYPSVFDLLIRGFLPHRLKSVFSHRLERYEMRDLLHEDEVFWNPELVSGCFMLFRAEVFAALQGFSPNYFMYFEDFDISIRARKISSVAYVPSVKIEHYGGYASRKGLKHISMFLRSARTFFNSHGWKIL